MLLRPISLLILQVFLYPYHAHVDGQARLSPNVKVCAAFCRSWTKFYIQGGIEIINNVNSNASSQFYALDLASSWTADAPIWIQLDQARGGGAGGPETALASAVVSPDEQYLLIVGGMSTFGYLYNIVDKTWKPSKARVSAPQRNSAMGVVDPTTGLAYYAGGFQEGDNTGMVVYDFKSDNIITTLTIPQGIMTDRSYYAGVYSNMRKSILYFGGNSNSKQHVLGSPGIVTEFVPSNSSWSSLSTSNSGPSHRTNTCMAVSEDGSKIVVFGGQEDTHTIADDIWILDIPSSTWIKGPQYGSLRLCTACTIVGNTFISWGGYDGVSIVNGTLVLFDVLTHKYINAYSPPPSVVNHRKPTPGSPTSGSGLDSSTSAKPIIIGASCAVVIVLAAMAAALIFLSQKQKKLKNNNCKGMTVGKKGHERDVLARNPQCQSQVQRSPQEVLPKAAASREWGENQHEDSTMDNTSLSMQQIEEREREKQKLMLAIREQQALIQQHQILLGPSLNYHSPQTYLTGMPSEQQRQWLPQQQGQLPIVHSSLFVPTNPSFRDPQSMPRNW